jgi:hypothetical protein
MIENEEKPKEELNPEMLKRALEAIAYGLQGVPASELRDYAKRMLEMWG